jgi:anti-sigma B factor antagonist
MDIVETDVAGVLVLEPSGGIDSTNAKAFTAKIIETIQAQQCNVVIDFQKIKYISSPGFRSLLIIGKSMEDAQRKLVLCGMGPEVRRVFEIARFEDLFVICSSREDAAAQAR